MKNFLFFLIIFSLTSCAIRENNSVISIREFQKSLNESYRNPKESPLRGEHLKNFRQHPFFPIDLKYSITAKFVRTSDAKPMLIPTSSGKNKQFIEYGKAYFTLDGKEVVLSVYQILDLMEDEQFKNYLFLPFRDQTNGAETYGGGKYLDLTLPEKENEILLDFNKSYHPYCAYNAYDYNCPIVPEENTLPLPVRAGVMYEDIYFH